MLCVTSVFSQIKGKVVDENNQPIPYVNIWVQNENIGTTSEVDGSFTIGINAEKNLIFSVLGFEKKTIKSSDASVVKLIPTTYLLNEVVVLNKKETKQIEIGQTKNSVFQAFDNGPKIEAKFFPYDSKYKKTKYIKKVTIHTDSRIDNATIKLHFYSVDPNGYPGEELLNKDYLVKIKSGLVNHKFDISEFNLIIPTTGIFVAYEKLMIESNKTEKTITDTKTNTQKIQKTYHPFVLYNYVEKDFLYTFSGGKWNKQTKNNVDGSFGKIMVFEPSINLILTN